MERENRFVSSQSAYAYTVGVRLQQAQMLHDWAETRKTPTSVKFVKEAVWRLHEALGSLAAFEDCDLDPSVPEAVYHSVMGISIHGSTTPAETTQRVLRAGYRKWRYWRLREAEGRETWSPLTVCLEGIRVEFLSFYHMVKEHFTRATHKADDGGVRGHRLFSWFRLGLIVVSGRSDETSGKWAWDDWNSLSSLLSELSLDLRDVYYPGRVNHIVHLFPARLAAWARVVFALDELQQGRTCRTMLDDPDCPIPDIRLDDEAQSARAAVSQHPSDLAEPEIRQEHEAQGDRAAARGTEGEGRPSHPERAHEESPCYHDDDFGFVNWYGTKYSFAPTQARCVQFLWEKAENGIDEIHQDKILVAAESESGRLRDVFGNGKHAHPAWGNMIVGGKRRGTYRLSRPVPPRNPKPTAASS